MMDSSLEQAVEILAESTNAICLTGAGISVESGIPAFRGAQGLWEKYDPSEFAHISSFMRNPEKVWKMLIELYEIIKKAKPNTAHFKLVELERMGILKAVITQNVDGLHSIAGNSNVIEFHGTAERLVCMGCGRRFGVSDISFENIPPRCDCGSILKPDVVFFGEPIPKHALFESFALAEKCDTLIVVGTSAQVYPAAEIPRIAKGKGAKVIEINIEPTPLTMGVSDVFIPKKASEALTEIVDALKKKRS